MNDPAPCCCFFSCCFSFVAGSIGREDEPRCPLWRKPPYEGGVRRRERASARAATGADAQGGGSIEVGHPDNAPYDFQRFFKRSCHKGRYQPTFPIPQLIYNRQFSKSELPYPI